MFARSLEDILRSLLSKGDFSYPPPDEMEARFHALRGVNLLPQGRARRAERLTSEHVAYAVLGLSTIFPAHSGFASKTLGGLVPAGGMAASFYGAATLHQCVVALINLQEARKQLLRLTLSVAEGGVNSLGYAELLYQHPERGLSRAFFGSTLAISTTGLGGETNIETGYRYAPASRELTLNTQFFQELEREIVRNRALEAPPGEGSEYDAVEAREAEYKRLGVRRGSRYLHIGVDAHVTWPMKSSTVKFGDYQLVLMPRTREHSASVHIDLFHHGLSHEEGRTVIQRFLSQLSWQDDHFAVAQEGWSGNPVPVPVPKREIAAMVAPQWWFDPTPLEHPDAARALALYREGRNAEENQLVSYAVLNYYKILEIVGGKERNAPKKLIDKHYGAVRAANSSNPTLVDFEKRVAEWNEIEGQNLSPKDYIYQAGRLAVAHGSERTVSDPDELPELRRLHVVADILRWLVRKVIIEELGVPGAYWEQPSA